MLKKTIWILDDDEMIGKVISLTLEESGYRTKTFETAKKLYNELKSSSPDLVIVDILLPDTTGTTVSKKIKGIKKHEKLPIILMSANDLPAKKLETSKAEYFIKKPFDIYDLISTVKKYGN